MRINNKKRMVNKRIALRPISLVLGLGLLSCIVACGVATEDHVDELEPAANPGKSDSPATSGLPISVDGEESRVWTVVNQWEDTDTPAARKAGLAWGENSGLSWDEKYSAWIQSMKKTPALYQLDQSTFELTTPWGKTLPAPRLDCADVWLFLRANFAAWYQLPFFMTGAAGQTKIFVGHFGLRTAKEAWAKAPLFAKKYLDQTALAEQLTPQELLAQWPKDTKLRQLGVNADDEQPFLGPSARLGAYLDEIHLNKRAAHFIRLLMQLFGTANLANGQNVYNLVPEAMRAGDALLYRNPSNQTGHTMVVKSAERLSGNKIVAEIVEGNLPPQQPLWQDPVMTREAFLREEAGSLAQNEYGLLYARAGGGLKRFRVAKVVNGIWINTFMDKDKDSWIKSTDYQHIGERVDRFSTLLQEVSVKERQDVLVRIIANAREHLRKYPASCSARKKRENAFNELYQLNQTQLNMSPRETDELFRLKEDYIFAELIYSQAKTCCWNSSTSEMYALIIDYVASLEEQATACSPPPVFKARQGDYDPFRAYAISVGKEALWKEWHEDESCPQRDVLDDLEATPAWTPYCELFSDK